VVILLAKKYPNYKIVNFDKLDYCSSLKNLDCLAGLPNYSFVKVRRRGAHARARRVSAGASRQRSAPRLTPPTAAPA
jgi:dTDP-D-glucose 4,6-dehydratase